MERIEANHNVTSSGYGIKTINNNIYSVIKKLTNVEIEFKIEEIEDFETDLIVLNHEIENFSSNEDLYPNHVVKEELVIGPEEIQENNTEIPLNIHKNKENNQTKTLQCIKLKKKLKTKESLSNRLRNVHTLKLCRYCNKAFTKTSNLYRHQNYFCSKNDAVAKNNKVRKYGMYTHPFTCDYCKKNFTHKSTLKNHIKRHMGVTKRYQCKLCDKSYTKSHNLTCHMQSVHLKIKTYACKYCSKRFSWKYGQTQHEKLQHSSWGLISCDK